MIDPPPVGCVIRLVAEEDEAGWRVLWDGYNAFYRRRVPEEVTCSTWARLLDPAVPLHSLVHVDGGGVTGFANHVFHSSTASKGPVCYLQDLFVAPGERGAGRGRALIEALAASAGASGAELLFWLTHETNGPARALYDTLVPRTGFIHYARRLGPRR